MKLHKENYFTPEGNVSISEQGWIDLQNFCKAILYKQVGKKYPIEDLLSSSIIACVEKLKLYNQLLNNELGGFLYWTVRGEISKAACKLKKEIPMGNFPIQDIINGSNQRTNFEE